MPQASVLSDADIRRVFRVIETTRHAERNRIAFMLSIYAGMRVGEIAALKGNELYAKLRPTPYLDGPLIFSQRRRRGFSALTLSMLFKEIYELAGIRTSSHSGRRTFATRLNAKGIGMKTIQRLMGHQHISTTALYCDVSDDMLRNAVELV